jgi:cytochrome c-type biogenesis protein CcmF
MVIAHLGIAVVLAGMAISSAWTQETLIAVGTGDPARVSDFTVRLDGVRPVVGQNWTALEGRLSVTRGEDAPFVLRPQVRYFTQPVTSTNESAIATRWDGQLYTVLGALGDDGRWQLRLWWKPFVTLIWAGGALIAIGGALSLAGHQWRQFRQRRRREEEAW